MTRTIPSLKMSAHSESGNFLWRPRGYPLSSGGPAIWIPLDFPVSPERTRAKLGLALVGE